MSDNFYNYMLLLIILITVIRMMFKDQGTYGLIIPGIILTYCMLNLLVGDKLVILLFAISTILVISFTRVAIKNDLEGVCNGNV